MQYIITFALTTRKYKKRIARFLETGAPPPDSVTMHGRWITLGHDKGFMLAETDDPNGIFTWVSEWTDLIDFEVHPVLTSEVVGGILSEM